MRLRQTLYEYCAATGDDTLLRQWDAARNGALTPCDVTRGSRKAAHWRCDKGHEWCAMVKLRTKGYGCPVCANRRTLPGENDLATTHPALAREWDAARNGALTPTDVVSGSNRRVWWRCAKGHSWLAAISSRAHAGSGCPYCAGKRTAAGENDLAAAFPLIAAEWDADANGALTPEQVTPSSNRKVWWRCPLGHGYAATVAARTGRGSGCPYCAGRRVLVGFNDLATKNPRLAAEWYQPLNGALTPEQVTCGSGKRVWWRCHEGHVWSAVVSSRAGTKQCGCPVCAGRVKSAKLAYYHRIAPPVGAVPVADQGVGEVREC